MPDIHDLPHASYHPDVACNPEPGAYYVNVLHGTRFLLALGPYPRHTEAMANVARVKRYVLESYREGIWYGFGTCKVGEPGNMAGSGPGKLNDLLGLRAN